eukprot:7183219-Prymnesium_polylepis.2
MAAGCTHVARGDGTTTQLDAAIREATATVCSIAEKRTPCARRAAEGHGARACHAGPHTTPLAQTPARRWRPATSAPHAQRLLQDGPHACRACVRPASRATAAPPPAPGPFPPIGCGRRVPGELLCETLTVRDLELDQRGLLCIKGHEEVGGRGRFARTAAPCTAAGALAAAGNRPAEVDEASAMAHGRRSA